MGTFNTTWEDEENNRSVSFSVSYKHGNDTTEIIDVTPASISFRCPQSGEVQRSIRIHTAAGRNMLANQIRSSNRWDGLVGEIQGNKLASA
jgi:hypothetical protein